MRSSVLLALCASAAAAHVMRSYNFVNVTSVESAEELQTLFEFSLAAGKSILLGAASDDCWDQMNSPHFRAAHRNSPAEYVTIATVPAALFPIPLAACAELLWYPRGHGMNKPARRTTVLDSASVSDWLTESFRSTILLRNGFSFGVSLHYVTESDDSGADRGGVFQGELLPGKEMSMQTFLGHVFAARVTPFGFGSGSGGWTVDFVIVNGASSYTFSADNYFNKDESCALRRVSSASDGVDRGGSCPNLPEIMHQATFATWHRTRLALNYLQPQVVRPVTTAGFKKIRVPSETYHWLREWFDNEKRQREASIEGSAGPCMNQNEAPSLILHLAPHLKTRMAKELLPVLQAWYEEPAPLLMTSIYGIRTYTNGSVLAMHVDTLQTHVVSAIINVDQDVDEPWLLTILDHSDVEVDLDMAPGDMVLYESSKLLHGRPVPMNGRRYENIFIHYRPQYGWEEYDSL